MTVVTHPEPGTIVRVDLNEGFRPPGMVKRRPCVVLSPPIPGRANLCSIVPLSTTPPNRVNECHLEIEFNPTLPAPYDRPKMWLKGDIVLTISFHRLRLLFSGWAGGQRVYDARRLDGEIFRKVQECVRFGLGL